MDLLFARCIKKANPEESLSHESFLNCALRLDTIGAEVAAGVKYSSSLYKLGSVFGKSVILLTPIVSPEAIFFSFLLVEMKET